MDGHFVLGFVFLAAAGLFWQDVYGMACLSSKNLNGQINYVNGLEDASQIEECGPEEVCYVERFVFEENPATPLFRAGCRDIHECKLISCSNEVTEKIPVHSGKRYSDEISLCTECCYNDTCNTKGCNGSAIDPEREKFHKKCFTCKNIQLDDTSTCNQMGYCDLPNEVCKVSVDRNGNKFEFNLGCEKQHICEAAYNASIASGEQLLLKCYDGNLQNFNPKSNHSESSVADLLQCPTALVPTTPTTTTLKTTTTTQTTTTSTTTPMTTTSSTTTSKATTTETTVPTTPTPAPTTTTQATTSTQMTQSTTKVPVPTLALPTSTIRMPTIPKTTPVPPTLPPRTSTSTLVPTSLDTSSPSLPASTFPTIPIASAIVTMAPSTSTQPSPTTRTTHASTTQVPDTTTTTPVTTTQTPATTTTTPVSTTQTPATTTTSKVTTTTAATTTPIPTTTTTTPTTPTPTTTTQATTTTTKATTTTTPTTPTPTTPPTTTPTTTTQTTTKTTTVAATTKAAAGHTIPPNPTTCFVCMDDAPDMCDFLYAETTCAPPNNYCINQVTNTVAGETTINRTCGNFDRCYKDWYLGSSDKSVCQTFDENQIITLDFECVYCCVEDSCNENMRPPANTLYEDK